MGINYTEEESVNAEWMSKNGQVPFLVGNNTSTDVFSGWRKILEMLEANQITLCPGPQRKEQKELLRMLDVLERVSAQICYTFQRLSSDRIISFLVRPNYS